MFAKSFSIDSLLSLTPPQRERLILSLTDEEATELAHTWSFWARPEQLAPVGLDNDPCRPWDTWLILAGRGFGKTRSGAEWVNEQVWEKDIKRIALIARTSADARDVMVQGESGLMAVSHPNRRPHYEPSKRRLTWPNGSVAITFSSEEPDSLRGPQYEIAWGDEPAAWKYPKETWDQLQMVLRLGKHPQALLTTTPRPIPLVKELLADETTVITRGSTYANKANLAPSFIRKMLRKYEGTRLGRQELLAEVLDDNPGALWKRTPMIDALRVAIHPPLLRIVVAVDPAMSANANSAETGIVAAGLGDDGHGYILGDHTVSESPGGWGNAVVVAYNLHHADRVVGEVNAGGDLVESNVRTAAQNAGCEISFKQVRASRGKQTRAEPISALYEQGRVHHVGCHPQLEDQLCDWDPTTGAKSPDRLDALVWALTELMLEGGAGGEYSSSLIGSRRA